MSTVALFVNTIILSVAVGIIIGGVGMNVLVVRPLQRRHEREHQRVLNAFRQGTRHPGTPYIGAEPGLRLVDGEPHYSSEWLNEPVARPT